MSKKKTVAIFYVRMPVTREIMRSDDAQCNNKLKGIT